MFLFFLVDDYFALHNWRLKILILNLPLFKECFQSELFEMDFFFVSSWYFWFPIAFDYIKAEAIFCIIDLYIMQI